MDDRHERGSTIVTSQVPVDHWHEVIGDPTIADAILDRLVHNAHRLLLNGESLRKRAAKRSCLTPKQSTDPISHVDDEPWTGSIGTPVRLGFGIIVRLRSESLSAIIGIHEGSARSRETTQPAARAGRLVEARLNESAGRARPMGVERGGGQRAVSAGREARPISASPANRACRRRAQSRAGKRLRHARRSRREAKYAALSPRSTGAVIIGKRRLGHELSCQTGEVAGCDGGSAPIGTIRPPQQGQLSCP